jgi:hypothetical protein
MKLQAQWIVGFVDGEGCFHIAINRNKALRFGYQILPEFTVVQHKSDIQVLYALKESFGCGVVRQNHGERWCYRVRALEHFQHRILPFFEKHTLKTKKHIEFLKFRDIVLALLEGQHNTQQGFELVVSQIQSLRKFTKSTQDKVQLLSFSSSSEG